MTNETDQDQKAVSNRVVGLRLSSDELNELLNDTQTDNASSALRTVIDQWKAQRREVQSLRGENEDLRKKANEMREELLFRHHNEFLSDVLKVSGILAFFFLIIFLISRMHGG